jgi:prepilin-type N-terminal cleavage/methylation domain-containing protein
MKFKTLCFAKQNFSLEKGDFNKGFTLIELLVSISIIGVLAAILVPNFLGTREKAQDSKNIQNLISLKDALRLYYNDNQAYPSSGTNGVACSSLGILSGYLPNILDIGCTYFQEKNGDAFRLCVGLNSDNVGQGINSQKTCGITTTHCGLDIGETMTNLYEVCAK